MVFDKTKGAKANDEYKQGLVIKDTWRLVVQRNKVNKHDPAKKNVSKRSDAIVLSISIIGKSWEFK